MRPGERLRREWRALKSDKPGRRFAARHERRTEAGKSRGAGRWLSLVFALLFLAAGVVLLFIPGPAFVFLGLGGALLAEHSLLVARALDASELRLRAAARWLRSAWHRRHSRSRRARAH
jgi:hypothetical protein